MDGGENVNFYMMIGNSKATKYRKANFQGESKLAFNVHGSS